MPVDRPDLSPAAIAWNARYPVGTLVTICEKSGREWQSRTSSLATTLRGPFGVTREVVSVDEANGPGTRVYPLESVTPVHEA